MRRGLIAVLLATAAACGSPTPKATPDAGHRCDGGQCGAASCMTDSDCSIGKCIIAPGDATGTCEVQCAVDSDCKAAGVVCNDKGQCVPGGSSSGATTTASAASSTGRATGSAGSSGRVTASATGSSSASSTTATSQTGSSSGVTTQATGSTGSSATSTSSATSSSSGTATLTTSSSSSTSSSTSSGGSGAGICSSCTTNAQCASDFCDIPFNQSVGFCDSTDFCTSNAQCAPFTCDTGTQSCSCPAGATATSSSSGTTGTSGSGATSTSTGSTGSTGSVSCTVDSNCNPPATVCSAGQCAAGCLPGQCASGTYCDIVGGHCEPATGAGALGASCTNFWDCQSSYCLSYTNIAGESFSQCVATCASTAQCPNGFMCTPYNGASVCQPIGNSFVYPDGGPSLTFLPDAGGNSIDSPCTGTNSTNTSACHSIFGCVAQPGQAGYCIDTCGSDPECQDANDNGMGWVCVAQGLGTNGGPPTLDFCSPPLDEYQCCSNSDCAFLGAGAQCGGADCGDGFVGNCLVNPVGSGCGGNGQCDHGLCVDGVCSEPCCAWANCPTGWTCGQEIDTGGNVFNACLPQSPDAGTLTPGDSCDTSNPNACKTDLCIPEDLELPGHAGYCSTTCCVNSDCPTGMTCELFSTGLPDGGDEGAVAYCILR